MRLLASNGRPALRFVRHSHGNILAFRHDVTVDDDVLQDAGRQKYPVRRHPVAAPALRYALPADIPGTTTGGGRLAQTISEPPPLAWTMTGASWRMIIGWSDVEPPAVGSGSETVVVVVLRVVAEVAVVVVVVAVRVVVE